MSKKILQQFNPTNQTRSVIKNLIKTSNESQFTDKYYVSDIPYRFNELASKFLQRKIKGINHVQL